MAAFDLVYAHMLKVSDTFVRRHHQAVSRRASVTVEGASARNRAGVAIFSGGHDLVVARDLAVAGVWSTYELLMSCYNAAPGIHLIAHTPLWR